MDPRCRETARFTSAWDHFAVQGDYVANINPSGQIEFAVPGGSPDGNFGYIDILDTPNFAIYEVKTFGQRVQGREEVLAYLDAVQLNCDPDAPWHLGMDYPTERIIPINTTEEIVAGQDIEIPGLIIYERRERQPEPIPVPVPQSTYDKIKDFVTDIFSTGEDIEVAARRFLTENPDLIGFIIGAAVTILLADLIKDIVTGGAGAIDTPFVMSVVYTLIRVAQSIG